jgi:hypothetical protein
MIDRRKYESWSQIPDKNISTQTNCDYISQKGKERPQSPKNLKIKNFTAVQTFTEPSSVNSKFKTLLERKESPSSARKITANREKVATVSIELIGSKKREESALANHTLVSLSAKITGPTDVSPKITILSARNTEKPKFFENNNGLNTERKIQEKNLKHTISINKVLTPRTNQIRNNSLMKTTEHIGNKNSSASSNIN